MNMQDFLNENVGNIVSFQVERCFVTIYLKDGSKVTIDSTTNDGDLYVERHQSN